MFSGAMTAMVTPFREGRLDENRLREQVEYQIKGGIDALVPVGTTGESPTVDFKEHARVIELTVQYARGRVPVIAGVGGECHQRSHRVASDRQTCRRDRGSVGQSVLQQADHRRGLYRHFMTLADRVDLPIVLYNIPGRTGITMSAQTVARLNEAQEHRRDQGSHRLLDMASEIMSLCDITVLSGDDSLTLPLMSIGGKGVISVASNICRPRSKR